MGRRQRPWGISVVTSSHMTTPKLKMSALELHGKPSRTCTREQMPMSAMHNSRELSICCMAKTALQQSMTQSG